jgi:hypothetical protein
VKWIRKVLKRMREGKKERMQEGDLGESRGLFGDMGKSENGNRFRFFS